jgi:hypothetical protein
MSWNEIFAASLQIDKTITEKLENLLTNQNVNNIYLDPKASKLLDEPLIFDKFENYDFHELPKEILMKAIDVMKMERSELTNLFEIVNDERKIFRAHNFKLLERLFSFENFAIENFDKDFMAFCNRSMAVHFEMMKAVMHREQDIAAKLHITVEEKNKEIKNLTSHITKLMRNIETLKRNLLTDQIKDPNSLESIMEERIRAKDVSTPKSMNRMDNRMNNTATTKDQTPVSQYDSCELSLKSTKFQDAVNNSTTPFMGSPSKGAPEPYDDEISNSIHDKLKRKLMEMKGQKQIQQLQTSHISINTDGGQPKSPRPSDNNDSLIEFMKAETKQRSKTGVFSPDTCVDLLKTPSFDPFIEGNLLQGLSGKTSYYLKGVENVIEEDGSPSFKELTREKINSIQKPTKTNVPQTEKKETSKPTLKRAPSQQFASGTFSKLSDKKITDTTKKATVNSNLKDKDKNSVSSKAIAKINSLKKLGLDPAEFNKSNVSCKTTANTPSSRNAPNLKEKFTMSYLLDQDVSKDSIRTTDISVTILKEIESELKLDPTPKGTTKPTHTRKLSKSETWTNKKLSTSHTTPISAVQKDAKGGVINTNPVTVKKSKGPEPTKK